MSPRSIDYTSARRINTIPRTTRTAAATPNAPTRSFGADEEEFGTTAFLPLYALRTADDWGVGSYTDLGRLRRFAMERGIDGVATLPLTAAFLDEPYDPSPYAPASRLFCNELYLDLTLVP